VEASAVEKGRIRIVTIKKNKSEVRQLAVVVDFEGREAGQHHGSPQQVQGPWTSATLGAKSFEGVNKKTPKKVASIGGAFARRYGGPHHVANEARFEAEASGMRITGVGGRWVVVVAGERRIRCARWADSGYADAKHGSGSGNHTR
jgi:hypothetical protein